MGLSLPRLSSRASNYDQRPGQVGEGGCTKKPGRRGGKQVPCISPVVYDILIIAAMAEIKLQICKSINCPDYGILKIINHIPIFELTEVFNLKSDIPLLFKELVSSFIVDKSIEISRFSERDLDFIAIEIAKISNVEQPYSKLRDSMSREEALLNAIKTSQKISSAIGINKLFVSSIIGKMRESTDLYKKLIDPIKLHDDTLKKMTGFGSALDTLYKDRGFQSAAERISKEFSLIKEMSLSNSLSKHLFESALDFKKMTEVAIPKLSLTSEVERAFRENLNQMAITAISIADAIKPVSLFYERANEAFKSISNARLNLTSINKQCEFGNIAIHVSEKIVINANDYFSKWRELPELPRTIRFPSELKEKKDIFLYQNEDSEKILENEADKSLLTSNWIARSLFVELRTIRRDVNEIKRLVSLYRRWQLLDDTRPFIEHLRNFSAELGANFAEVFWKVKGEIFISKPERTAKSHLGMYLKGKYGGAAFIGSEIHSGNGFIDIFVYFMGRKYIVEIKIVGCGWSIEAAEQGIVQLDKYMHSENQDESYLVVIDGRKTDRGKKLKEVYELEHGRVFVATSKIFWA